jgi:hypothetical protein
LYDWRIVAKQALHFGAWNDDPSSYAAPMKFALSEQVIKGAETHTESVCRFTTTESDGARQHLFAPPSVQALITFGIMQYQMDG